MKTEYSHEPVLLAEVLQQLSSKQGSTIVDCTIGGAGHAEAVLEVITPEGSLLGIDRDDAALDAAKNRLTRFSQHVLLVKGNYADFDSILTQSGIPQVDGILFDLGLSSAQIDEPSRGFSYRHDAPLDMRMDPALPLSARDLVNSRSEAELLRIFRRYGEEKWASRIAAFIVAARERRPINTTFELVDLIKQAIPASARRAGGHPAKRVFQALRIEVNQEIDGLEQALTQAPKWLRPGGRVVVISYHSLEDRVAKDKFRQMAAGCVCPPKVPVCVCGRKPILRILTKRPVVPSPEEVERNPRARSARLRAAERCEY